MLRSNTAPGTLVVAAGIACTILTSIAGHTGVGPRDITIQPSDPIQPAIDRLARNDGGTCLLASGTHVISQPLRLQTNTVLAGEGPSKTTLKMDTRVDDGCMIRNAHEDMHDVTIRDMTIDTAVTERETELYEGDDQLPPRRIHGILLIAMKHPYQRNVRLERLRIVRGAMNVHIKGCENLTINRCEFSLGGGFTLLHNLYLRRVHGCRITDCYSHDSRSGNGFQASFSSDLAIARNLAIDNRGHGIRVAASEHIRITDNVLVGNRNGLWLNCEKGEIDRDVTCTGNVARHNREAGIWIRNTRGGVFGNNVCLDNGFDVGFRNAFDILMRGNRYETTREEKRNEVTFAGQ